MPKPIASRPGPAGGWPLSVLPAIAPHDVPTTTLCLCGDIMTGQGLEPLRAAAPRSVHSALEYVHQAEPFFTEAAPRPRAPDATPLPRPVCFDYPWGDALALLRREQPDLRLLSLEASITARGRPGGPACPARLPPPQLPLLAALGVHGAVLANRHALGFGREGLRDTLELLREAGIAGVGAGQDCAEAGQEACWLLPGKSRVRLLAFGHASCGLPREWAADEGRAGINWLPEADGDDLAALSARLRRARQPGDLVVVALSWGSPWGFAVTEGQRRLARALIDEAGVDLVWGNASCHPRPIEVYRGRLILYGVGHFLKDAGAARGHEHLRPDLAALYLPRLQPDGRLAELRLLPLRVHLFRLRRASPGDAHWLARALGQACRHHGTGLEPQADGSLRLYWQ